MGTLRKNVWHAVQAKPDSTSVEIATVLQERMADVSSKLTELFRRNQVTRTKRTFINDDARQQTIWQYRVIGKHYVHVPRPMLVLAEKGSRRVVPSAGTITTPAIDIPTAVAAHVAAETPPKAQPASLLTEAEQFAAYLEFKAMKKAGVL